MKKTALSALILLLLFHHSVAGQAPAIQWQKFYGSGYLDDPASIEPTADGGYIMTGLTNGPGADVTGYHGNKDVGDYWVAKVDAVGTLQWTRSLGGSYYDQAAVVRQAPDGSFVVAGQAASVDGDVTTPNHGGTDFWIVKLSSTGAILWQKSVGGSKNDYLNGLDFTPDGGFILAGWTESNNGDVSGNHGGRDLWVVKLSSAGNIDWQKCLGGSQDDEAYGVLALADGSYVAAGYTLSNDGQVSGNHGNQDMWVVKLDNAGNLLWSKTLGGSEYEVAYGLEKTADGGCVVAGYTSSFDGDITLNHGLSPGDADFWVVKLDNSGALQWQKCYGGSFNEIAYSIAGTPDGGFLVGGYAGSADGDVSCYNAYEDGWVIKINSTGALQWAKTLGGMEFDEVHSVKPTADGGAIVAIYSDSKEIPGYHPDIDPAGSAGDFLVVKLLDEPIGTVTLSILPPPVNICSGTSLTLQTTSPFIPAGASYQWTRNGATVGTHSPTYTASDFVNGDQVTCTVNYFPLAGCSLMPIATPSNTVVLVVSPLSKPVIQVTGNGTPACYGAPIVFSAAITNGNPMPVYQWLLNGNPAPGATNTPTYSSTILSSGDVISCVYSDNAVCVAPPPNTSNAIAVRTIQTVIPTVSIAASGATTVCAGGSVLFTATPVNGGASPGYQWQVNGGNVGTNSRTFLNTAPVDGDIISCVLSSNAVCSTPATAPSNEIVLAVKPLTPSSVAISPAPATICSGKEVTFTALPTGVGPAPVYQWQINGANVGGNSAVLKRGSLVNGDVVTCLLSDPEGCVARSSGSVTPPVSPSPTLATAQGVNLSKGQEVTLDLSASGDIVSYLWTPATGLSDASIPNPVASPAGTTVYTLLVTTAEGCAASGTVTVKIFTKLAIPGAFTPNGDGRNDIFYVIDGPLGSRVKDLGVFNRWGQRVFQVHDVAPNDPSFGWNGRVNGVDAPTGAYVYEIQMSFADGTQQVYRGTVVLVR
jgi:gliding motility-associated-like protein